jgi:hypothetical protein
MVTDFEVFQRWVGIISGKDPEHRLTHGHYITKQQRSSPDVTWQEVLQDEIKFLTSSPLWGTLKLPAKMGCLELRKKLSVELSCLIRQWYKSPCHVVS